MENSVELDTRPLTAAQVREILIAAHSRLAAVFGEEGRGLAWHPPTFKTRVLADAPERKLLEDLDDVRWGNGRLEFNFGLSAKYYEGQTRLFTSFVLSLIKGTVIGFGLFGTEKPGQPIVRVALEWGFITDVQAEALRELFGNLLRANQPPQEENSLNETRQSTYP